MCNFINLKDNLNKYFQGDLSKKDLCDWAMQVYEKLLKGDFIILDNIVIYSYIKSVANFNNTLDDQNDVYPTNESEIEKIKNVLNGEISDNLIFSISLPPSLQSIFKNNTNIQKYGLKNLSEMAIIDDLIKKYFDYQSISQENYNNIINIINQQSTDLQYIALTDIVRNNIYEIFKKTEWYEEKIKPIPDASLFPKDKTTEYNTFKSTINNYLDIYFGRKNCLINIVFIKGVYHINVSS